MSAKSASKVQFSGHDKAIENMNSHQMFSILGLHRADPDGCQPQEQSSGPSPVISELLATVGSGRGGVTVLSSVHTGEPAKLQ